MEVSKEQKIRSFYIKLSVNKFKLTNNYDLTNGKSDK